MNSVHVVVVASDRRTDVRDCSHGRAPSKPLNGGRNGSDASGWPVLAVRLEGWSGSCEVREDGGAQKRWREDGRRDRHQRRRRAGRQAVAALVEAVVAVVVRRVVFTSGAGHVVSTVVMAHHFGVRSRLLLAQQRSRRYPRRGSSIASSTRTNRRTVFTGFSVARSGYTSLSRKRGLCNDRYGVEVDGLKC